MLSTVSMYDVDLNTLFSRGIKTYSVATDTKEWQEIHLPSDKAFFFINIGLADNVGFQIGYSYDQKLYGRGKWASTISSWREL